MESKLKEEILIKVSHEIRSQISGNIGLIELLNDTEPSDTQKEYLDLLKFSSDRLFSLVSSMLNFSKMESGKYEPKNCKFNLPDLIEKIVNYFKFQTDKKGLDLYYKISNKLPNDIIGDLDALSQILFNLIENSLKFTQKGNISLKIDISFEDIDHLIIRFHVKDTGIGISDEKLNTIFKDFQRLNASNETKYEGSGLGLSIAKKLIEIMGGSIEVKSELGKGSEFIFYIKFLKDNVNYHRDKQRWLLYRKFVV